MRVHNLCKLVLGISLYLLLVVKMGDMEAFRAKYSDKVMSNTVLAANGQCMIWTGTRKRGRGAEYGVLCCKWGGRWRTFSVHRLSIIFSRLWHLEDISERGMDVSHLCHNSLCVNPQHLTYEPHQVNRIRSACVRAGQCTGHNQQPACLLHLRI